jgi:hypothetical protein
MIFNYYNRNEETQIGYRPFRTINGDAYGVCANWSWLWRIDWFLLSYTFTECERASRYGVPARYTALSEDVSVIDGKAHCYEKE